MNQSGEKKRKLIMPGEFDISVSMEKAIQKADDEFRMSLGLATVINKEERKLLSKLAKERKSEKDKTAGHEAEVK